jgi:hypothetical protein
MNNSGAIYVAHDHMPAVARALTALLAERGFRPSERAPGQGGRKIMLPDKRLRLFFLTLPQAGWVTIWEDPRYFAERKLAQQLAARLATRTVWIEVGGNAVSWCYGLYRGDETLAEAYEPLDTTFYGEYGTIYFTFDAELGPDELIEREGLPFDELHYEAVLAGEFPAAAGALLHLSFERHEQG